MRFSRSCQIRTSCLAVVVLFGVSAGSAGQEGPPAAQQWAIIIGISEYQDDRITPLRFAHRDAVAFAQFLRSDATVSRVPDDNMLLLLNEGATEFAIENALFNFLQRPAPGDVVYVFFAGHGMPEQALDRGPQYLLPYDASVGQFAATAIQMSRIQDALQSTRADVILFVDACRSGGVPSFNASLMESAQLTGASSVIVAAGSGEGALEDDSFGGGHGVFTHSLLEGLAGAADADGDRIVELAELFEHTRGRVAERTGGLQTPVANISSPGFRPDWPLGRAGVEARTDSDLDTSAHLGMLYADVAWIGPEHLLLFQGVRDSIRLVLDEPGGTRRRIGPRDLNWRSSDESVVRVDRDGMLEPIGPGSARVEASALMRRHTTTVQVYEAPDRVRFQPSGAIELTTGEEVRLSADVTLRDGDIVTGLTPVFDMAESAVLAMEADGRFNALRPGSASVTGSLAGERHTWEITVRPPGLSIDHSGYGAMVLGDSLPLRAHLTDRSGEPMAEASEVRWRIPDQGGLVQRNGWAVATGVGRTTVVASAQQASDSLALFVLGDLLVSVETPEGARILTLSTLTGEIQELLADEFEAHSPSLSPDGRRIAFVSNRSGGRPRIHLMDADGSNIRRLTSEASGFLGLSSYREQLPVWSHDGRRVLFVSNQPGNYEVFSVGVDVGDLTRITRTGGIERWVTSAPDRPEVMFERVLNATDSDVYLAVEGDVRNLTADRFVPPGAGHLRESKPTLLGAERGALVIEGTGDYRDGDGLVHIGRWNTGDPQRLAVIAAPRRDHEVLYAASPAGDRVAFLQRPRLGGGDPVITVSDLSGTPLQAIELPEEYEVIDLRWGAAPGRVRREGHDD